MDGHCSIWEGCVSTSVWGMAKTKKPTQKKTSAKKKTASTKAKSASKKKHPSAAVKKSETVKAVKTAVEAVVPAVEKDVQEVLETVIVYANDLKSTSLRQRVLAWFKKSK